MEEPTEELLQALKEGNEILNGKIDVKEYHDINELMQNLEKNN